LKRYRKMHNSVSSKTYRIHGIYLSLTQNLLIVYMKITYCLYENCHSISLKAYCLHEFIYYLLIIFTEFAYNLQGICLKLARNLRIICTVSSKFIFFNSGWNYSLILGKFIKFNSDWNYWIDIFVGQIIYLLIFVQNKMY
jgi:hypothetical protein